MGMLVDGKWTTRWYDTGASGTFVRPQTQFRDRIGDEPGAAYPPVSGRYHLYVSRACPWCHRVEIIRRLEGLEEIVGMSVVNWYMGDEGWTFAPGPGVVADPILNATHMHQIYTAAQPDFTGRVTVPVLWDRETHTIVNNESAEIGRMFDQAFDRLKGPGPNLYPVELRPDIDRVNALVFERVNNGVYRCGFATSQQAYEAAFHELFEALDWLESRLVDQRYLCGSAFTEADIRLYVTLLRFDPVYFGHFKCNRRRIADYVHLSGYLRDIHQRPGIAATCDMQHIKSHYYGSHPTLNPSRIVPCGPELDLDRPHGRSHLP